MAVGAKGLALGYAPLCFAREGKCEKTVYLKIGLSHCGIFSENGAFQMLAQVAKIVWMGTH